MEATTFAIIDKAKTLLNYREFHSLESAARFGDRIIELAEELVLAKAARIAKLETEGPGVFYNFGELNIVLLRDGEEKFITFGEYSEQIVRTNDPAEIVEFNLEGPPDEDGFTYFIHASPGDYGQVPWGVYISKKEAVILKKKITEAATDEFADVYD